MTDTHEGSTGCSSDAVVDRMMARRSQEAKEIQLTDDVVGKMKYVELKETAKRLKLSASGTKAEVRNILLAYVEGRRARVVGAEDSDEETDEEMDEETDEETEKDSDSETEDEPSQAPSRKMTRDQSTGKTPKQCAKKL
ncbi:hypothetical protein M0802_015686 [Mischocyttarus mexicanus]|nr:hypothetical protein M0802_015686 [Mischocyttarus mexicanus]